VPPLTVTPPVSPGSGLGSPVSGPDGTVPNGFTGFGPPEPYR